MEFPSASVIVRSIEIVAGVFVKSPWKYHASHNCVIDVCDRVYPTLYVEPSVFCDCTGPMRRAGLARPMMFASIARVIV